MTLLSICSRTVTNRNAGNMVNLAIKGETVAARKCVISKNPGHTFFNCPDAYSNRARSRARGMENELDLFDGLVVQNTGHVAQQTEAGATSEWSKSDDTQESNSGSNTMDSKTIASSYEVFMELPRILHQFRDDKDPTAEDSVRWTEAICTTLEESPVLESTREATEASLIHFEPSQDQLYEDNEEESVEGEDVFGIDERQRDDPIQKKKTDP